MTSFYRKFRSLQGKGYKKPITKKQSSDICKLFIESLVLTSYSSYVIGNFHGAPSEIHVSCISQQGFLAGVVQWVFSERLV